MIFGQQLKVERKRKNLSAQDLATACGVTRSYISLLEGGQRLPGRSLIPIIAGALNLTTLEIVNWYLEDLREKLQ